MYAYNNALIFIKVTEPNNLPYIKSVTIGSSDPFQSDLEFYTTALKFVQDGKTYPPLTRFEACALEKFKTVEDYQKFLYDQLQQYLDSL